MHQFSLKLAQSTNHLGQADKHNTTQAALKRLWTSSNKMAGKRKSAAAHGPRKRARHPDEDLDSDEAYDVPSRARSTRSCSRAVISDNESTEDVPRRLRARQPGLRYQIHNGKFSESAKDDDLDELQQDFRGTHDDNDGEFVMIVSDVAPPRGRPKGWRKSLSMEINKLRGKSTRNKKATRYVNGDDSDVEFETEGIRRSSRANKVTKNLRDPVADEDDIYYDEDAPPVTTTPRVVSIRENFQPCDSDGFKELHRATCTSCGHGEAKGQLIYCQGCSYSYHKICIGSRSERTQRVTKVGPDNFVLQCQYCVGKPRRGREIRAPGRPHQDQCQVCRKPGKSCAAFSQKRTLKVEEKLRAENGGEYPVAPVPPMLLNNPDHVLFRCGRCRRAYHFEHLPHPTKARDPAIKDPKMIVKHRLDEYSITWQCKECQELEQEKIDKMVAWRPRQYQKYESRDLGIEDFNEDELEYLIKWADKSYEHCLWLPGAMVYEFVAATMRISFYRKAIESEEHADDSSREKLLCFSEEEAIPDVFLTPEVILAVRTAPRSAGHQAKYKQLGNKYKKEDDLARIYHVLKMYVKYEGLGYNDAVWETPPSPDSKFYPAFQAAYEEYLAGRHFAWEGPKAIQERIDAFRKLDFPTEIEYKEQPAGFKNGTLMKYQVDGLNWLLYNYTKEKSVILADEMGLGKTVQVVAFLRSLALDKPKAWPFLIVVPNATCQNWRREIKKWAPELRVVLYYGGSVPQNMAMQYELFPDGTNQMMAHIVVMSFQSAVDISTRGRFSSVKWAGLVVDEAHSLKNDANNLPKALKAMKIPFSLLLTGTPLQNNKKELFTLMQFVDRSIDAVALDDKYSEDNLTKESIVELHDMIRPHFMRRTKTEVLKFLPPMSQIIVPLSMTVLQEKLCKSILEKTPQLIRAMFAKSKVKASDRAGMNNILLQLRKCLCHPFIYSRLIEDRSVKPDVGLRNLIEASSKLLLLEVMLPKLQEQGHRVLLFTQFLDQLDIMEDLLGGLNLRYQRIDGSLGGSEKQKRIDQFNHADSSLFAMLLSTRAGGVGINLATADTVIILDPDWNPHQDIQALSRAHRIGQKKKVLCFQLVTQDSVEERILQIGRKKMALDHVLIETMDSDTNDATLENIESVLRFGAAALFGEGRTRERITYDAAAVEKLLERAAQEETGLDGEQEKTPAENAFAFARVWANDAGELKDSAGAEGEKTVNLSVWDQIIKQREEEARREEERNREILGRGGRRRHVRLVMDPPGMRCELMLTRPSQATNYVLDGDGENEMAEATPDEDFVGGSGSEPESTDGEKTDTDYGEFGDTAAMANGARKRDSQPGMKKTSAKAPSSQARTSKTAVKKAAQGKARKANKPNSTKQTPRSKSRQLQPPTPGPTPRMGTFPTSPRPKGLEADGPNRTGCQTRCQPLGGRGPVIAADYQVPTKLYPQATLPQPTFRMLSAVAASAPGPWHWEPMGPQPPASPSLSGSEGTPSQDRARRPSRLI